MIKSQDSIQLDNSTLSIGGQDTVNINTKYNTKEITKEELFEIVKSLSKLDEDNEINLTPIANIFDKEIRTWKRSKDVVDIIEVLKEQSDIQKMDIGLIREKKGGNGEQGTFTNNPDLFLEFLRYCSPKIALRMTKIVRELFQTGAISLNNAPLTLTPNIYQNIDFKKELQLIQDKLRAINSYVQSSWITDEEKMILLDEIKITSGLAYTTVKEHEKEIRKTLDCMKDGSIKIGNCMYSYKLSTANIFNAIKAKEILKRLGYDLEDLYTTQTRKKIVRTFID